jgi:hypothetical protein
VNEEAHVTRAALVAVGHARPDSRGIELVARRNQQIEWCCCCGERADEQE